MKLTRTDWWTLGIAAGFAALIAACASFELEGEARFLDQEVGVKVTYDGRDVNAEELPDDNRADVKFYDKDGNEVPPGATGVGQGEKVPVPPGAAYVELSGPSGASSCTGCTTSGGGSGGGGGGMFDPPQSGGGRSERSEVLVSRKWVSVFAIDADLDGSSAWSNVDASFHVDGNLGATQLHAKIANVLFGGPGTPLKPGVSIGSYVRLTPEVTGARLVVADVTHGFATFQFTWNNALYASLGQNSQSYALSHGWQVVDVFIPALDINLPSGTWTSNHATVEWMANEDHRLNVMDHAVGVQ